MNSILLIVLVAAAAQAAPYDSLQSDVTPLVGRKVPKVNNPSISPRIVFGTPADEGQFPHAVAIRIDGSRFCSGSLISYNWVLTAAQCVKGFSTFEMLLGSNNRLQSSQQSRMARAVRKVVHSGYNRNILRNDIALLELNTTWNVLNDVIHPIDLPPKHLKEDRFEGDNGMVAGWGRNSNGSVTLTTELNYAPMIVISNDKCKETYAQVNDGTLCAEGLRGSSICLGDNGASLQMQAQGERDIHYIIGVASFWPAGDCQGTAPSGFTRVTSYLDWISANTGIVIQ